jgi:hypothetical protein
MRCGSGWWMWGRGAVLSGESGNVGAADSLRAFAHGALLAWPLFVILALLFVGSLAIGMFRRVRLARSGMLDIDRMSGRTFEQYLEVMFA